MSPPPCMYPRREAVSARLPRPQHLSRPALTGFSSHRAHRAAGRPRRSSPGGSAISQTRICVRHHMSLASVRGAAPAVSGPFRLVLFYFWKGGSGVACSLLGQQLACLACPVIPSGPAVRATRFAISESQIISPGSGGGCALQNPRCRNQEAYVGAARHPAAKGGGAGGFCLTTPAVRFTPLFVNPGPSVETVVDGAITTQHRRRVQPPVGPSAARPHILTKGTVAGDWFKPPSPVGVDRQTFEARGAGGMCRMYSYEVRSICFASRASAIRDSSGAQVPYIRHIRQTTLRNKGPSRIG